MSIKISLTAAVGTLLLWGSFFMKLPILLFLGLALAVLSLTLLFMHRLAIDRIGVLLILNMVYWLGSGLVVGAVDVADLGSLEFYSGDGRIFIFYMPLLFYCVSLAHIGDVDRITKCAYWISLASLALFAVWAATGLSAISRGPAQHFVGLMTHHTGAGTFFAVVTVALSIYGAQAMRRKYLFAGVLTLVPVIATGSRQSLVAICVVALWYAIKERKLRFLGGMAVLAVVVVSVMPVVSPNAYERSLRMLQPETFAAVFRQMNESAWEPGDEKDFSEEGEANLLSRALYWSYAIKRFAESPVLGIGYGRYNDHRLQTIGVPGLLSLDTRAEKVVSPLSAHNSYLHLLAESGVVGLALMVALWASLYLRLQKARKEHVNFPAHRAYFMASQGLVIFVLAGAMFAHGLASPSVGVPALTFIGLALSLNRRLRLQQRQQATVPLVPSRLVPGA